MPEKIIIVYFISIMSKIGELEPPATMPPAEVQRIKNLTCPPPILPSKVSGRLVDIQNKIAAQTKTLASLVNQVNDLESRLNISFSAEPEINFDLSPGQLPYIDISGTVQNIILDFHLWPARKGIQGLQGQQGQQGLTGLPNTTGGAQGNPGYYGIRGNYKK
jgi:hypothetical protein